MPPTGGGGSWADVGVGADAEIVDERVTGLAWGANYVDPAILDDAADDSIADNDA